jgi:hypothetical protein
MLQSFCFTSNNALIHTRTTIMDTRTVTCGCIPCCKTQAILARLPEHGQSSTNECAGQAWTNTNKQAPGILQKNFRLRNTHSCLSSHKAACTLQRSMFTHSPVQHRSAVPTTYTPRNRANQKLHHTSQKDSVMFRGDH